MMCLIWGRGEWGVIGENGALFVGIIGENGALFAGIKQRIDVGVKTRFRCTRLSVNKITNKL